MSGQFLQFSTREDALPVERLNGVRDVVTISIIVVGVVLTSLAGWDA